MQTLVDYYSTTLGKKFFVAVTGLILFAYVFIHMAGNLQLYAGPALINSYAEFLHSSRAIPLLWITRIVLLAAVIIHITATVQLWWRNLGSRPVKYDKREYLESPATARWMIWSGPAIGLFVIYHILHLTTHTVGPHQALLYDTMVAGFKTPYITAIYVVAVILLGRCTSGTGSGAGSRPWGSPIPNTTRQGALLRAPWR
ncbi:MAG: succinate dehydrogenase cytochrome b subunit [Deltaproteobacteria bacterium]|nr:succinate dehydrogenase cytochrome b subunit [Deltaproteobacteria bacterium]